MVKIAVLDSAKEDGLTATYLEPSLLNENYSKDDYKLIFDDFFREAEFADLIFVDFGELASIMIPDMVYDNYRELIHFLADHPSKNVYFCLTMNSDFYEGYEDLWVFPNAVQIDYHDSPNKQKELLREAIKKKSFIK
jgi:hypothetical protein